MARYIDADALNKEFERLKEGQGLRDTLFLDGAQAVVDSAETADVAEVKRGEWMEMRNPYGELEGWIHKECGRSTNEASNYCPTCGATMNLNESKTKEENQ